MKIVKSAWGNAERFSGDIHTHLMAIDPVLVSQFSQDGTASQSQIALEFACKPCHLPGSARERSDAALISAATGYHARP